jgi:hypothetical protein
MVILVIAILIFMAAGANTADLAEFGFEMNPCTLYSRILTYTHSIGSIDQFKKKTKTSFGSRNRPLKWNDYSYGIVILLFGRGLFFGIHIPLRRGIAIPWGKCNIFQKKPLFYILLLF